MRKLQSGSVIEIFIKDINIFGYIKYIDTRELFGNISYPFQFRIYQNLSESPLPSPNEVDFSNLLLSPLHLTGFKALIESGEWKVTGRQDIHAYDKIQHHYKMAWPPNLAANFMDVKQWRVLRNINNVNDGEIVPYNRCAHLEYAESLGASHLILRVLIEYFKSTSKPVIMDKSKWDKFDHILYNRYINMPLYKNIQNEFKGKLLPEHYDLI